MADVSDIIDGSRTIVFILMVGISTQLFINVSWGRWDRLTKLLQKISPWKLIFGETNDKKDKVKHKTFNILIIGSIMYVAVSSLFYLLYAPNLHSDLIKQSFMGLISTYFVAITVMMAGLSWASGWIKQNITKDHQKLEDAVLLLFLLLLLVFSGYSYRLVKGALLTQQGILAPLLDSPFYVYQSPIDNCSEDEYCITILNRQDVPLYYIGYGIGRAKIVHDPRIIPQKSCIKVPINPSNNDSELREGERRTSIANWFEGGNIVYVISDAGTRFYVCRDSSLILLPKPKVC